MGPDPHHHIINVTVSGSWWRGEKDEVGIPHTTMRDGAPNGYAIMTFNGKKYDWEYVPARRPADHQMHIAAPEAWLADGETTEAVVNIFGGSERSIVEMKVTPGTQWTPMEKVLREDPYYVQLKSRERETTASGKSKLPETIQSTHLWRALLPPNLSKGTQRITVRTRDMFGKEHQGERLIRIE